MMGDPAALQEAIQRARQLAAKISAPSKRPLDHSGPVKVTLAYEKPAKIDNDDSKRQDHHRSASRDYIKTERDSRDYKSLDHRDNNHNSSSNHHHQPPPPPPPPLLSQPSQHQPPAVPPSSAPPSSRAGEEKIELIIPHAVIGLVIGKGGENIKRIQNESGATVRVDPNTIDEKGNKLCTITGSKHAVDEAHAQVANVIESAAQNKRPRMQTEQSDSYRMKIPAHRTGAIIGKGGETIKGIKQQSGCEIELDKNAKECGPEESVFIIRGSQDKIQKARSLIEQRLARGTRDGPSTGVREHHHHSGGSSSGEHSSSRNQRGGVATGANAAPVAQYTDLPTPYGAAQAGQQNTADMTAAWAAYMAQYSSLYSQPGAQPGAQTAAAYGAPGQPNMLGTGVAATSAPNMVQTIMGGSVPNPAANNQIPGQQLQATGGGNESGQPPQAPGAGPIANQSQDYTDQWIEFYMANGRPDYAEQMIQMKKQQSQSTQ